MNFVVLNLNKCKYSIIKSKKKKSGRSTLIRTTVRHYKTYTILYVSRSSSQDIAFLIAIKLNHCVQKIICVTLEDVLNIIFLIKRFYHVFKMKNDEMYFLGKTRNILCTRLTGNLINLNGRY